MSDYTKSTNFATKDNLTPGDPLKIVRGTEIDTEFNNIATAIATKTDNASAAITGGSITGITDLAIADGGTGASTATGAINNLLPSQTGNANKYLQTDGTNVSWDAVSLSTSDITGTLPVANGGTGVTTSTGTGSTVLSNSPTLVTPALGTPASATLTNATGLPISTGVSGLGTGVATFLATPSSANLATAVSDETGSGALVFANSPTLVTPALGTPSSGTLTNATGLPISTGVSGLGTGVATFLATPSSANLAAAVTDETGTGALVFANSPTLVTPALGTPSSATLTNATGLPISTGVSGLGTGVATALAVNVGSAGAPVVNGGALGTPSSGTVTNLTGTASININGTVGATTPTTGAFTTLTTSSTVTLNGGTANGVTYLNASKVLTSGSALTFDGTTLGVTSNSTTPALKLYGAAVSQGQLQFSSTSGYVIQGGPDYTGLVYNVGSASYQHIFQINGTEGMRLTSTGLGIGTSSPSAPLDINTSGNTHALFTYQGSSAKRSFVATNAGVSSNYNGLVLGSNATSYGVQGSTSFPSWYQELGSYSANGNAWKVLYQAANSSSTELMRLDSSGNLGLGVTPSAWSGVTAMQVSTSSMWSTGGNNGLWSSNVYYNGTSRTYIATNSATEYQQSAGKHIWSYAASGTAGNAISFTQAMTLDASGNLGIGTSSPATKLDVLGSGDDQIRIRSTSDPALIFSETTANKNWRLKPSAGNFYWQYSATAYNSGYASLMILDSSGNLGLGVTPVNKLNIGYQHYALTSDINTGYIGTNFNSSNQYVATNYASQIYFDKSAGSIGFRLGGSGSAGSSISWTSAMTLDASGNLLVGTTSALYGASGRGVIEINGSAGALLGFKVGGADKGFIFHDTNNLTISNTVSASLLFQTGNTERARIDSSGNLKIGTTTGSANRLYVSASRTDANRTAVIDNAGNTSGNQCFGLSLGTNTNNASSYFVVANGDGADRLYIYGNGNIVNLNNSYGALSDIKLKENIVDATPKLEKLNQIRIVNYNLKGETQKQIGVIAQELEQIFPSMVDESPDLDSDGNDLGTTTKQVKYSVFVPMLIKAIQEQQALITQLQARLDAANL